jgi:hypothetical protein
VLSGAGWSSARLAGSGRPSSDFGSDGSAITMSDSDGGSGRVADPARLLENSIMFLESNARSGRGRGSTLSHGNSIMSPDFGSNGSIILFSDSNGGSG